MGNLISNYLYKQKNIKLCNELIDNGDFMITVSIHTINPLSHSIVDALLHYIQYTKPILSYMYRGSLYLLYSPSRKSPFLRSNVSG